MSFIDTVKGETKDIAETLTGISFKKSFTSPTQNGRKVVGFNETAFQYVDQKYRVVIENTHWRVNAWLQDDFEFKVGSHWDSLISIPGLNELAKVGEGIINSGVKAATGATLHNVAMTRRKWTGSDPLQATLKLKFRTYDNADKEVLQACQALQSMCLPAEMELNLGKLYNGPVPGFLIPPGPNEMYIAKGADKGLGKVFGNSDQAAQSFGRSGDIISIDLFNGGFYLDMVVINDVTVKFDSKMTEKGPVAAEVTVNLQSYEVLTKQKLGKVYNNLGFQKEK